MQVEIKGDDTRATIVLIPETETERFACWMLMRIESPVIEVNERLMPGSE